MKEKESIKMIYKTIAASLVLVAALGAKGHMQSQHSEEPRLEEKVIEYVQEKPIPKIYKIICPEEFTIMRWIIGEGYQLSTSKARAMYEALNGIHIPQPGQSTLFLQDLNNDERVAGIPVTEKDEVTDFAEMHALKATREERYNKSKRRFE